LAKASSASKQRVTALPEASQNVIKGQLLRFEEAPSSGIFHDGETPARCAVHRVFLKTPAQSLAAGVTKSGKLS
jgi:hypothetical protein